MPRNAPNTRAPSTMNPTRHLLPALLALLTALPSAAAPSDPPARLRRADSFLGVHFDFHAGPDCTEIGRNTTPAMIERIIDLVRPDYLQTDCKGHRGLSSYATRVGNPAPGFVGEPLRIWRDVTARRGVSLYLHYSGVWDSEAILQHPDWAAINADGKTNANATSFWSPYADRILIPQLRELASDYGIDGVWVDGECWASVPDYGPAALAAFQKATGIAGIPRKPSDPNWHEFLQFHREAFRGYLRHYIAEVKKTHPRFEICSNWAYTDHMAEPVSAPLDFLSGDYSPEDSVNSARLSGRFLVRQGMPWDLMAWSFSHQPVRKQKSAVQLTREAAVVVALGGGFQAYFTQNRDGSVRVDELATMAEAAQFCRARQTLCHRSLPVPQVALLLSTAGHYRRIQGLFNRDLNRVHGTLRALLESQLSVEVVNEGQLAGRLAEYPLIVVPEWDHLEPAFRNDLAAYARAGGNLLLVGPRTAALFAPELGLASSPAPSARPIHLGHAGTLGTWKGEAQSVPLPAGAAAFGQLHATNDPASPATPAASISSLGRGRIAATYFAYGQNYASNPSEPARRFLADLVGKLFPEPMVAVAGSRDVDVVLARNHGKLMVNLVNTGGPHRTQPILETLPPVGPLQLALRLRAKPARLVLQPSGRDLPFEYADGSARCTVPPIDIHEAVVVEP